jgi:hypothetical protein
MVHPPRTQEEFSREAASLREDGKKLEQLMALHLSDAPTDEAKKAWREYMRIHSALALLNDAMPTHDENSENSASDRAITPKCVIQESQGVLADGFSLTDLLALIFSPNSAFRQPALLMLSMSISLFFLQGREAEAQAVVQQVSMQPMPFHNQPFFIKLDDPLQFPRSESNAQILQVENGRVLASIQHPNPRYGRFRYLFEKDEIPAHIFQDLKRGCSLTVEFDQDVEGGIKAIRVKGFHPATMEPDETPKLIGGAFEDMDRRRENEGKLNAHYAAVMDEARRIREQQTPS